MSLNDTDDSFELALPPPGTPGTDLKPVPYPVSGDGDTTQDLSTSADGTAAGNAISTPQETREPVATAGTGGTAHELSAAAPAADQSLPGTDFQSVPDSAEETETRPGNCLHCNEDEQLIVDLNYYRQLLNILKQIDQDRKNISPDVLDAAHRSIAQTRPRLAGLLATGDTPNQVMPGEPAVEDRLIAALPEGDPQLLTELLKQEIAESDTEPDSKTTAPPQPPQPELPASVGIDGLYLAHVDNQPGKSGAARVILVSHEQPFTRTEGGIIRHNGKDYKVVKISYGKDRRGASRRQVTLQDMSNNETHVIPWQ